MKTNSLGFIGGGRITRIFLQAMKNKQIIFNQILVFDTNPEITGNLKMNFPEIRIAETAQETAQQNLVFIALHPPVIMEMLEHLRDFLASDPVIISFAPKITIDKIASKLATSNILRMIPNATSFINEGYNPVTFAGNFDSEKKIEMMKILNELGQTFEVSESKLEAYAIVSAMLPTYFWFQWNQLTKIGTQIGLTEEESRNAVWKTIDSANKLMFQSGLSPDQVIDLIPVKPIGEYESQINEIYQSKLTALYEKIKA